MKLVLLQPALRAFESQYNLDAIESLIAQKNVELSADDIIVLPEQFMFNNNADEYRRYIQRLAQRFGCTIVGGSHHRSTNGKKLNVGNVVDARGNELGIYTKLRPYFNEQKFISAGDMFGEVEIGGKHIMILICADFWYSDIFSKASKLPDIVLVPALSVSRKPAAEYSATLWKHLAIARAYEFGVYVGISDWAKDSTLPQYRTCGVGGFADPTLTEAQNFFQPISQSGVSVFELDFDALEAFRADRRMRGFFWK